MNFRDSIRELYNKPAKELSAWERKVKADIDKTREAYKALEGQRLTYAPRSSK